MAGFPLVDTNIFVRHLRQDHPNHSPRASAYIGRIEAGELVVQTNELVVFETIYTLQTFYKLPKIAIAQALLPLIDLPGLKVRGKPHLRRALDWYVRHNLSFTDAYLAALTREQKLPALVTFDRDYDRIPGIPRVEP